MSTTMPDTTDLEAEAYLKAVAPYLATVPAEERAELLDDLAEHLREIAAEPGPPLIERLGPPAAYAAELLASAGVAADARPSKVPWAGARRTARRLRESPVGREATRWGPVMRPFWWVLRAYLAVSALAALLHHGHRPGFPVPHLAGNAALGFVAVVAAIAVSLRLGQRGFSGWGRRAAIGANLVLAVYAVVLAGKVGSSQVTYVQTGSGAADVGNCLTDASGQNITNLYAYSPDGTLLDPVLLYDQNGQPIDNLCPTVDAQGRPLTNQYALDTNGAPVYNAFPRGQSVVDPGSVGIYGLPAGAKTVPTLTVPPPAVVVPRLAPTTTTLPATTTTTTTAPAAAGRP